MIDEVSDTLGWDRKHAIKALNGRVSLGQGTRKRGSKASPTEEVKRVVVEIWKRSEQPCGKLLKPTVPLWLDSYENHHGELPINTRRKVPQCSPTSLRSAGSGYPTCARSRLAVAALRFSGSSSRTR